MICQLEAELELEVTTCTAVDRSFELAHILSASLFIVVIERCLMQDIEAISLLLLL